MLPPSLFSSHLFLFLLSRGILLLSLSRERRKRDRTVGHGIASILGAFSKQFPRYKTGRKENFMYRTEQSNLLLQSSGSLLLVQRQRHRDSGPQHSVWRCPVQRHITCRLPCSFSHSIYIGCACRALMCSAGLEEAQPLRLH